MMTNRTSKLTTTLILTSMGVLGYVGASELLTHGNERFGRSGADPIERARQAVASSDRWADTGGHAEVARGNFVSASVQNGDFGGEAGSVPAAPDAMPIMGEVSDAETISLNVDDQEVRVILRNIAELFSLNIVVPEELTGRTSLNLRDVTWQQVFNIVLEDRGYSWAEVDGIIRIRRGLPVDTVDDARVVVLPNGNVNVDFRNTSASDIVDNVARALDLNVVLPPDEAILQELNLRLNNVSWEQVLTVTLRQFEYGFIEQDGVIEVQTLERINSVPNVSRVFQIRYSEANAIAEILSQQTGIARVVTDTRSNVVIVTGNPARFAEIRSLIDNLDRPTPQVMIESRFVEVSNNDVKRIGVDWASLFREDGYSLTGAYESGRTSDRFTDESVSDQTGSDFQSRNARSGTPAVVDSSSLIESTITQVRSLLDSTVSNRTDTAIFSAPAFNIVLRAIKQLNDSKIISNPTVLSLNGQEAAIKIIDHYYMQQPGSVSADGRVTQGQVQRLDPLPGIELQVTPTISGGDFISLKVVPQVNDIVGSQQFTTGNVPIVRQRTALTHVMVKDRETLAIGGLVDEKNRTITSRVPLLGSIPGLGRLFRYDNESLESTNQIIFITASILNPNETNYVDIVGIERLNNLGLTDRDVMGARYPLSAEEQALNEAVMEPRRNPERVQREDRLSMQLEAYRQLEEERALRALKQLEQQGQVHLNPSLESDTASASDYESEQAPLPAF